MSTVMKMMIGQGEEATSEAYWGNYRWWWGVLRQNVQQKLSVAVSESCLQRKESTSFWTDVQVLVGFLEAILSANAREPFP